MQHYILSCGGEIYLTAIMNATVVHIDDNQFFKQLGRTNTYLVQ